VFAPSSGIAKWRSAFYPFHEYARVSNRGARTLCVQRSHSCERVFPGAFRQDCTKMDDEASYGSMVELLQRLPSVAADAGIVLGREPSLSLEDFGN
jgi:hypothetical protein